MTFTRTKMNQVNTNITTIYTILGEGAYYLLGPPLSDFKNLAKLKWAFEQVVSHYVFIHNDFEIEEL